MGLLHIGKSMCGWARVFCSRKLGLFARTDRRLTLPPAVYKTVFVVFAGVVIIVYGDQYSDCGIAPMREQTGLAILPLVTAYLNGTSRERHLPLCSCFCLSPRGEHRQDFPLKYALGTWKRPPSALRSLKVVAFPVTTNSNCGCSRSRD